jgi:hypothetical protein
VAEPPRDEFPNNFVGDLVHDERGWVVVPPTYCPDGHGYGDSLPHIRRAQVKCRIVASGLSVGGCATLKPSTPNCVCWLLCTGRSASRASSRRAAKVDGLSSGRRPPASTRLQGRQTGGTVARAAHSGGRRLGFRIHPGGNSERANSGSCSAPNFRGEAGHAAQDPRCPPGHYRHGAVRPAHRGPRAGGGG